jgi:hypothetical protein
MGFGFGFGVNAGMLMLHIPEIFAEPDVGEVATVGGELVELAGTRRF